ncbi:MBOAT, membrane-bound O-acyltransferase family-domain-containing protein [Gaertneriomyces semiglobifer]|nr:MBOAT, membrane-bound O-acyltransferase family-domain-containing protein [Gaertneriomyces semiglobifer]
MWLVAFGFSKESHPSYQIYKKRLSNGWLFGREVDNSDAQYASFRNNLPTLGTVMLAYLALSHVVQRTALRARLIFSLAFSLAFLFAVHGASVLKILIITFTNYAVTKAIGHTRAGVAFSWIWSIAVLFANDKWNGYSFGAVFPALSWLDEVQGINMRWWVTFNISTLRMISFTMDYYWTCNSPKNKAILDSHRQRCPVCSISTTFSPNNCATARLSTPLPHQSYNLLSYWTYLLYIPLYLAGPIITFNDFYRQIQTPTALSSLKGTLKYAARWVGVWFVMEVVMHTCYVVAVKDTRAWKGYSPFEMSMVGYWNLKLIWLKLLVIWRFFRLWALADGVETVENMTRCMSNNYSGMEFWRSWHRSYNRWLVRYIYLPLGGRRYYALSIFPIFTWVAIWHDISLRLLTWGWLVSLFILPELLLRSLAKTSFYTFKVSATAHRHLSGLAATFNILLMMIANLVGFAVGVDGVKEIVDGVFGGGHTFFVVEVLVALYSAAQLMFEIRESEQRAREEKELRRRS